MESKSTDSTLNSEGSMSGVNIQSSMFQGIRSPLIMDPHLVNSIICSSDSSLLQMLRSVKLPMKAVFWFNFLKAIKPL